MVSTKESILSFIEENLSYNTCTGNLEWLNDRAGGKVKSGSVAGSTNGKYKQIKIFGKWYKCHRLVWLLKTGDWPSDQIDHINRDSLDNRFENLRDVSNYTNCLNRKKKSSSGVVGVTFDKVTEKWRAQTCIKGVHKNLGRFNTVEEALEAYNKANVDRQKSVAEGVE